MVLGMNTRAFTLADTVGFGLKTQYKIPLSIEADKDICLASEGSSLNRNTICAKFGDLVPSSMKFIIPATGKQYVLMGVGDFQIRQIDGTYTQYTAGSNNPSAVDLFKGSSLYNTSNGRMTLRDAFQVERSG